MIIFFSLLLKSDIRQLRHRLLHCQVRSPHYFRTSFTRGPQQELEDRKRDSKIKQNLIPANRPSTSPLQGSSSDPKQNRTVMTAILIAKEPVDIIRHAT